MQTLAVFRGHAWPALARVWWGWRRPFCPEGAATNQPRAERSGESRGAPPWVTVLIENPALKGRNKGVVNLPKSQALVKGGRKRGKRGHPALHGWKQRSPTYVGTITDPQISAE